MLLIFFLIFLNSSDPTVDTIPIQDSPEDFLSEIEMPEGNQDFGTDVNQMMKILINSIYQSREVFSREIISNGSDALEKIRRASLTNSSVLDTNPVLKLSIKADRAKGTLLFEDTGIGMTKDELINNLGTIANSATGRLLEQLTKSGEDDEGDLIGKFGVGFYSAFLVAEKVVVISKSNNDDQYIWSSNSSNFNVMKDPRGNTLGRGTQVILYMKEESKHFLTTQKLRELIEKYSQFISFPIYLWEEEKDKSSEQMIGSWKYANPMKPLWTLNPSEVSESQYIDLYQTLTKDSERPIHHMHINMEGEISFSALVYVPSTVFINSEQTKGEKLNHFRLYTRRVFITDSFGQNEFMPTYLKFLIIIVNSEDFPLSVSREQLQESKLLKLIKRKLRKKILDLLGSANEDVQKKIWEAFSSEIKLGIAEDEPNRKRLAEIIRFPSSLDPNELTTLKKYHTRMQPGQKGIYYFGGQSRTEVTKSPFIELLLKRGIEVLYIFESVDEHLLKDIETYKGILVENVAIGNLDNLFDHDELKAELEIHEKNYKEFMKEAMQVLEVAVSNMTISTRLVTSSCLVKGSLFGMTGNMMRYVNSRYSDQNEKAQRDYFKKMKKIFEINPYHPIVKELKKQLEESGGSTPEWQENVRFFYQLCEIRSQFEPKDIAKFAGRAEKFMRVAFGIPAVDEQIETIDDNVISQGLTDEPELNSEL